MANGVLLDPELGAWVENETDFPTSEILGAMSAYDRRLLQTFGLWAQQAQGAFPDWEGGYGQGGSGRGPGFGRAGSLFERDRYVTPVGIYDQMRVAYEAIESDDIVSGVLESTEAMAFGKISFYADDEDEEDVYNQIAADIDLDSRLREMWREMFAVSQFYAAIWWTRKTYKVRGATKGGVKRKKEFDLRVPRAITMLDPLKIVPVGNPMFNREQLAYIADRNEYDSFTSVLDEGGDDAIVQRLILNRYEPNDAERKWIGEIGVDPDRLFLLNPAVVFRHTATRPQYQRFATVRMKSVFELLDMKNQLRQMDRAHLIGGTNFIVLITKGTDDHPAKPTEIANLQGQVRTVARVPVMVGDHRLHVEIVTPKLDNTLKPERYNTVDSRITARLYQMFMLGNYAAGGGGDDSVKLAKFIAKGLESRRHMLRRTLEEAVFSPIYEQNPALQTEAKMLFHPKQIALDFDAAWATFLLDLRSANEISRNTILSQFDLDQADEARMLEREAESYDEIFQTQVPFSTPNPKINPDAPGTKPAVTPRKGGAVPVGGNVPPHSHDATGNPVPLPTPPTRGRAAKPTMTPAEKRAAGRTGGGTRNGGGAAPGSGQGQAPRNPRRKSDGTPRKRT